MRRSEIDSQDGNLPQRSTGRVLGWTWGRAGLESRLLIRWGSRRRDWTRWSGRTEAHDFEYLKRVIRDYDVREIVVGLPLRMSGAEGMQSEKMRLFAEELRKKSGLPVHLWDERLTSAEANRFLRETELSIEKRGKAVDRMAAVLILQGWMEHRARAVPGDTPE